MFFKSLLRGIAFRTRIRELWSRSQRVANYYSPKLKLAFSWIFSDAEFSNYYYALSQRNLNELRSLISVLTNTSKVEILSYFNEIIHDESLAKKIRTGLRKSETSSMQSLIGRRIGWYTIIRVLKPRLVVETGVHHGVGSLVISAALRRNLDEGFKGEYLGTEINSNHGRLFWDNFPEMGTIQYGDSVETLNSLEREIDIFINDSDHSSSYESQEYEIIWNKLSKNGLVISDNCHASDSLFTVSLRNDWCFQVFREEPLDHWYPGGSIGFSFEQMPLRRFQ